MSPMHSVEQGTIGIVGPGYVGLPLAVEFGKRFDTMGFDVNATRVNALRNEVDTTCEVFPGELVSSSRLQLSMDPEDLRRSNVYIVTCRRPSMPPSGPTCGR